MSTSWNDNNEETPSEAQHPEQHYQGQRPPSEEPELEPLKRAPLDRNPVPRPPEEGQQPPSPYQAPSDGVFPPTQDPFSQQPPQRPHAPGAPSTPPTPPPQTPETPPQRDFRPPLELDRNWQSEPSSPPVDTSFDPGFPPLDPLIGDAEEEEELGTFFSHGLALLGVVMVAVLLGAMHYFWQHAGARPVSEVEALQLQQTLAAHRALVDSVGSPWTVRVGGLFEALDTGAEGVKVLPLFPMLAALTQYTLNAAPDLLFSFNAIGLFGLLLGVYALGRCWLTPGQAWYATAVVGLTPALIGATSLYSPMLFATACVIWGLAALARSVQLKHAGWVFVFALCCGLLLLSFPAYLLYFVLPFAACLIAGISLLFPVQPKRSFDAEGLGRLVVNLFILGVVVLGISMLWYVSQWRQAAVAETEATASAFAGLLPTLPETGQAWLLAPWLLLNESWFAPLTLLVIFGLIGVWIIYNESLFPLFLTLLLMLGGWAAWTLYADSLDSSLLLPMAVCGALIAGSILCAIPGSGLRGLFLGMVLGLLAIQFLNIATPAFGALGRMTVEAPGTAPEHPATFPPLEDIVIYNSLLHPGRDYFPVQESTEETPHPRLLQAMLHRESVTSRPGDHAPYVELGLGGAALYQQLYGLPQFTPETGVQAVRPPRRIGYGEAGWARLEDADYVVAVVATSEWPDLEARLEGAGLIPVEAFAWNDDRAVAYHAALYMTTRDTVTPDAPDVDAPSAPTIEAPIPEIRELPDATPETPETPAEEAEETEETVDEVTEPEATEPAPADAPESAPADPTTPELDMDSELGALFPPDPLPAATPDAEDETEDEAAPAESEALLEPLDNGVAPETETDDNDS